MASSPDHPGVLPSFSSVPEDVDTVAAAEAQLQAIRDQLTRRINRFTHPSRLINQLALADWRCSESVRALAQLIGRSPKILRVIRAQLRKAFEIEPDTLLFTEPKRPGAPQIINSLTERALSLLTRPSVPINVNQFTTLSIKGQPSRRLPYTPLQALQRVIAMRLFERLAQVADRYWDTLAQGSWLTRRERWVELHAELFADRAFMARQLDELSPAGMRLVQAVIDAPTAPARQRAGGDWATVRVGQLMWPGTPAVVIPGVLHLYREGDPAQSPQVVYLPGVARTFYEYPSFAALQEGLLRLDRAQLHVLWQCLASGRRTGLCQPAQLSAASGFVRGLEVLDDALALGAQALLRGQWNNELACAVRIDPPFVLSAQPPRPVAVAALLAQVEGERKQWVGSTRLGALAEPLLKWDQQRRSAEIIFASTSSGLALRTAQQQVKRYEKGLLALLDPYEPGTETLAYQQFITLKGQLAVHAQALNSLLQGAEHRLLDLKFWAARPGGAQTPRRAWLFMHAQTEALRCEVQVQHRLKLLGTAHRDLMIDVLDPPSPSAHPGSQTQVLSIAVGSEPDAFYPLHNVWLVTTAAALRAPTRQLPVVLYAFGEEGGVLGFAGLEALTRSVKASLGSRDGSVLWRCVEHDKRSDLRAHALRGTLAVRYVPIDGKPVLAALKKLLGCYDRLHKSTEDITRIFSEVTEVGFSRALLLAALAQQLKVPANNALSQAQANIELLRKAASDAQKLPAGWVGATRAQRKDFKRSQRLYLSSALAFQTRLEQHLPDLDTFARRALTARLQQDGVPASWLIDQPFIEMPDDVHGRFCGWASGCTVGNRGIVLTATSTRTSFSLLQLALHNLDPLAPWTQWRLNRARFLQPEWRHRLNAGCLIQMVASLDIGGQYDTLINRAFYPPAGSDRALSEARIPALLNRALHAGVDHHLFLARQGGLSANAQSVFSTAMAARMPPDLLKNQHELQLHVVHLVGHTMQHDRYVAGIVVVQDQRSECCVVYWRDAPQAWVLTEYSDLQQAQAALNRVGASADNAKVLARQVAPGWAFEAITHHPDRADSPGHLFSTLDLPPAFFMVKGIWRGLGFIRSFSIKHLEPTALLEEIEAQAREQIASDPQGWLAIVATSHSDARALLYHASVLDLQRRTQAASHSGKALQAYRARRLGEQSETRTRALVGFFCPLYGIFNQFHELLLMARRYHRFGDAHAAVDVGFMSTFLAIDVLLNFIPGPKRTPVAAARMVRPATRAVLGRIHRLRMTARGLERLAPPPVAQLKGLERFKINGVPQGAVALKGVGEKGVYVLDGELFVADDTHHYPLYRRGNEHALRLKNRQAPGQDELIVHVHQPREWLLGADAPQPVAGSSSTVLSPWRAPVQAPPDWQPPTVRAATQNRIYRSPAPNPYWFEWRVQDATGHVSGLSAFGTFHVHREPPGFPYDAVYIGPRYDSLAASGAGYYRVLHQGDNAPWNGIAFITRNEPLVSLARVDIERWTSTAMGEQPIPVSRSVSGEWQVHAPLFDRPLEQSVGQAFPSMTRRSQTLAAARLIELTDSSRSATATHLLNIRSTLDNWLVSTPNGPGQTDDLLRMLRPTERTGRSLHIGYEGKAPGFTRVDFRAAGLDAALQSGGREVKPQRILAQRAAVKRALEQQGFNVQELQLRHGRKPTHELIATHPSSPSNTLYYVSIHWIEKGSVRLETRLTDRWFDAAINAHPRSVALMGVKSAMNENRLARIVAGIQWPTTPAARPSVYFVKVSPSSP